MYLVEYTKIYENDEKKFCLGYYSGKDALKRVYDIISCSNTKSVVISRVDSVTKICDLRNPDAE